MCLPFVLVNFTMMQEIFSRVWNKRGGPKNNNNKLFFVWVFHFIVQVVKKVSSTRESKKLMFA